MRQLVLIFAVCLVWAAIPVPAVSSVLTTFDVNPVLDADAAKCNGVEAGSHVCNSDCTKVLLCRGSSEPIELDTCTGTYNCYFGECSEVTSSCELEDQAMKCTGRGLFPDPYNCTNYHVCEETDSPANAVACRDGWAFDSSAGSCSKQLDESPCTELPISCDELGQGGAFPGNENIYYYCVKDLNGALYPALYKCPHGGTYDATTLECTDVGSGSQGSAPSPGAPCTTQLEIVPDPEDCYSYYQCLPTMEWIHYDCIDGFYFDKDEEKCLYGACPSNS